MHVQIICFKQQQLHCKVRVISSHTHLVQGSTGAVYQIESYLAKSVDLDGKCYTLNSPVCCFLQQLNVSASGSRNSQLAVCNRPAAETI